MIFFWVQYIGYCTKNEYDNKVIVISYQGKHTEINPRDPRWIPTLKTSSYLPSPRYPGTSGTPGTPDQSHSQDMFLSPIPSPGSPGTPCIQDKSQLSRQVPTSHPPGNPGTIGTTHESHLLRQVPISYPQSPSTPGTPATPDEFHLSKSSFLPSPYPR